MFYHYINRLANALLGETPLPSKRTRLKSPLKRMATRIFLDAVNRPKDIGESLSLLPKADLPK